MVVAVAVGDAANLLAVERNVKVGDLQRLKNVLGLDVDATVAALAIVQADHNVRADAVGEPEKWKRYEAEWEGVNKRKMLMATTISQRRTRRAARGEGT